MSSLTFSRSGRQSFKSDLSENQHEKQKFTLLLEVLLSKTSTELCNHSPDLSIHNAVCLDWNWEPTYCQEGARPHRKLKISKILRPIFL